MKTGWFADLDQEAPDPHKWQPCLQAEEGICLSFEIWFKSKEECERYIQGRILGQEMID